MMAGYWKSVQRILSGQGGAAIPRLRSRYEPDPAAGPADIFGEPVEADMNEASERPGGAATSRPDTGWSESATGSTQPISGHERKEAVLSDLGERPVVAPPPSANTQDDGTALSVPGSARANDDDRTSQVYSRLPQMPIEAPVDLPPHAADVPGARLIDTGPGVDSALPADRKDTAAASEGSAKRDDAPDQENGPDSPRSDDDREAHWLAELRAEFAAAIDLAKRDSESGTGNDAPAQPESPRPIMVEIDHLELAITRPAQPMTPRPARQDRAAPVVSLEAFLSQTGGGGS